MPDVVELRRWDRIRTEWTLAELPEDAAVEVSVDGGVSLVGTRPQRGHAGVVGVPRRPGRRRPARRGDARRAARLGAPRGAAARCGQPGGRDDRRRHRARGLTSRGKG